MPRMRDQQEDEKQALPRGAMMANGTDSLKARRLRRYLREGRWVKDTGHAKMRFGEIDFFEAKFSIHGSTSFIDQKFYVLEEMP